MVLDGAWNRSSGCEWMWCVGADWLSVKGVSQFSPGWWGFDAWWSDHGGGVVAGDGGWQRVRGVVRVCWSSQGCGLCARQRGRRRSGGRHAWPAERPSDARGAAAGERPFWFWSGRGSGVRWAWLGAPLQAREMKGSGPRDAPCAYWSRTRGRSLGR